jgi:hypothetical protein
MTRRDVGMLCIFTTQTALRENAQPYRFWGLLGSCLAAEVFFSVNISWRGTNNNSRKRKVHENH